MSDQRSDVQLQNLLAALTDAWLVGNDDVEALVTRHDAKSADLEPFVALIGQLSGAMTSVQPSPRFVQRLRQDLTRTDTRNVLVRVRRLPPRVQIAAGIALLAGFVLLSRRRLVSEPHSEQHETVSA